MTGANCLMTAPTGEGTAHNSNRVPVSVVEQYPAAPLLEAGHAKGNRHVPTGSQPTMPDAAELDQIGTPPTHGQAGPRRNGSHPLADGHPQPNKALPLKLSYRRSTARRWLTSDGTGVRHEALVRRE